MQRNIQDKTYNSSPACFVCVQERLELESLLHSLLQQDPTSCYAQLRSAVLRCNKIRNIPGTHQQMALENQVWYH